MTTEPCPRDAWVMPGNLPMECNACAVASRQGRYYTATARVFLVVCPACGSDDVWQRRAA